VREKVYQTTQQEVPYSTAVTIDAFEERAIATWWSSKRQFTSCSSQADRDRQGHSRLKTIGQKARLELEELIGARLSRALRARSEGGSTTSADQDFGL
jgi:GTP-binding protein Era